jgi:hypothetical protein
MVSILSQLADRDVGLIMAAVSSGHDSIVALMRAYHSDEIRLNVGLEIHVDDEIPVATISDTVANRGGGCQ